MKFTKPHLNNMFLKAHICTSDKENIFPFYVQKQRIFTIQINNTITSQNEPNLALQRMLLCFGKKQNIG